MGAYAIDFQYLLVNEKAYTKERLLTIRNIVSTLFLAEGHYDIALLEQELLNLYDQEGDKQAVSLFLNWFRQLALYGKVSPEDYGQLDYIYRTKEEVQTMLAATLEQERKKIYQKGEAAGLAQGLQAQRQTILQLLQFRFTLSEVEQQEFALQLEKLQKLQLLTELTNGLLNKESKLEDFVAQLTNFLPGDEAT